MEKINITTPIGNFKWAFITKSRKNLSGVKQYSIVLELSPDDAAPIIKELEDLYKRSGIKTAPKSMRYKTNDEGNIEFSFKTNEFFADGTKKVIAVYDSKGRKVELGDRLIGNGSQGRVRGVAEVYQSGPNSGVTLYLNAIQITKFVEYEGDSFDAVEEGGFTGFEPGFDEVTETPDLPKF